jgi:hypothetical protein
MINPLKVKESCGKIEEKINGMEFYDNGSAYPKELMDQIEENVYSGDDLSPPKCMFLPNKSLIRTMVKANCRFSKRDSLEQFLLRFGMRQNEQLIYKSKSKKEDSPTKHI